MHFACLSIFDQINVVFSNALVQPGPKIFNTVQHVQTSTVFNVDRALKDKRPRERAESIAWLQPERLRRRLKPRENELKPREDNDSDQVSSHDKAIVVESVHV